MLPTASAAAFRCGRCTQTFRLTPPAIAVPAPALPAPLPPTPLPYVPEAELPGARPRWARRALGVATGVGLLLLLGSFVFTSRSKTLATPHASEIPPLDTEHVAISRAVEVDVGTLCRACLQQPSDWDRTYRGKFVVVRGLHLRSARDLEGRPVGVDPLHQGVDEVPGIVLRPPSGKEKEFAGLDRRNEVSARGRCVGTRFDPAADPPFAVVLEDAVLVSGK